MKQMMQDLNSNRIPRLLDMERGTSVEVFTTRSYFHRLPMKIGGKKDFQDFEMEWKNTVFFPSSADWFLWTCGHCSCSRHERSETRAIRVFFFHLGCKKWLLQLLWCLCRLKLRKLYSQFSWKSSRTNNYAMAKVKEITWWNPFRLASFSYYSTLQLQRRIVNMFFLQDLRLVMKSHED